MAQLLRAVAMRLSGEAKQLQRQDREDAGHGVENDAAKKGQQQRLPPGEANPDGQRCGKVGADLEGAFGAVRAAQGQHTIEGRGRDSPRIGLF